MEYPSDIEGDALEGGDLPDSTVAYLISGEYPIDRAPASSRVREVSKQTQEVLDSAHHGIRDVAEFAMSGLVLVRVVADSWRRY